MPRKILVTKTMDQFSLKRVASIVLLSTFLLLATASLTTAQTINLDASNLIPRIELSFSPRTGSFVEGSTFEIPILLNTKGAKINGLEVRIIFDKDRLEIIKPAGGQSIIGVWVETPVYDNSRGTASYVGVIPSGINTNSGLVGTITFKAKKVGRTKISFNTSSKVLLNDGQGSEAQVELGTADYTILPKAPEGVVVSSETHPFQSAWYNNNSPVLNWNEDPGVTGFSYLLDDKPSTIPPNVIVSHETSKQFVELKDGLWYFHIKALKGGVWGTTGDFLMRIDTAPPAEFQPEINYLVTSIILAERALVSFFTTDNLSGIDHYEVGVIDQSQPITTSPVFVQTESPFQLPLTSDHLSVIIRAVDKAGNIRDVSAPVGPPSLLGKFVKDHLVFILLLIICAGLVGLIAHYLVGHHLLRYWRKAVELEEKDTAQLQKPENVKIEPPYEAVNRYPESGPK